MQGVKSDGLNENRVYGKVCPMHPELNGLRNRIPYRECVGCKREKNARLYHERKAKEGPKKRKCVSKTTLHFGKDEKFEDTWRGLQDAMWNMGLNG